MLAQDNNFYLICLSFLIIVLLDNIQMLQGKLHVSHFYQLKG